MMEIMVVTQLGKQIQCFLFAEKLENLIKGLCKQFRKI